MSSIHIPVYQWYEIPPNTPGDISDDEELSAFDDYTEEESALWDRLFGSIILSPIDILMMNFNNDEEPINNEPTNEEQMRDVAAADAAPEKEEEIYPDNPPNISGEYASQEFNTEYDMMWPMDMEEDI
jgi:hypothetical protein